MLYYIIGKIYLGCNGKFEAGYGLLHLQKNSLRNITGRSCRKEANAFPCAFLSVCYPLSKVSGAEDES